MNNINVSEFQNMCRSCMYSSDLINIQGSNIIDILQFVSGCRYSKTDELPQKLCIKCMEIINEIQKFAFKCKQTHLSLTKCLIDFKNHKNALLDNKTISTDNTGENINKIEFIAIKQEVLDENDTSNLELVTDVCNDIFTNIVPNCDNMNNIDVSDFQNMCRSCMYSSDLINIEGYNIIDILQFVSNTRYSINDELPQKLCVKCIRTMNEIQVFAYKCKQSHLSLTKCLMDFKNNKNAILHNKTINTENIIDKVEFISIKQEVLHEDDTNNLELVTEHLVKDELLYDQMIAKKEIKCEDQTHLTLTNSLKNNLKAILSNHIINTEKKFNKTEVSGIHDADINNLVTKHVIKEEIFEQVVVKEEINNEEFMIPITSNLNKDKHKNFVENCRNTQTILLNNQTIYTDNKKNLKTIIEDEDTAAKRRRLNREKQQRWRKRQNQDTSNKLRRENAEHLVKDQSYKQMLAKQEIKNEEQSHLTLLNFLNNQKVLLNLQTINTDDEDPVAKKRRLNKEKQQRWRSRQSQETLDRLRKRNAERVSNRRECETQEQREARRTADAIYHAHRSERETPEETQARRAAIALAQAKRRQKETLEQTLARRAAVALSQAKRRRQETLEQTQARRAASALAQANRRQQETPEQTQARRAASALSQANRRQQETFEQTQTRRAAVALSQAIRRQQETFEQRQARRAAVALSQANRRQQESQKQKDTRRAAVALSKANHRQQGTEEQTQVQRTAIALSQVNRCKQKSKEEMKTQYAKIALSQANCCQQKTIEQTQTRRANNTAVQECQSQSNCQEVIYFDEA